MLAGMDGERLGIPISRPDHLLAAVHRSRSRPATIEPEPVGQLEE